MDYFSQQATIIPIWSLFHTAKVSCTFITGSLTPRESLILSAVPRYVSWEFAGTRSSLFQPPPIFCSTACTPYITGHRKQACILMEPSHLAAGRQHPISFLRGDAIVLKHCQSNHLTLKNATPEDVNLHSAGW